MQEDNTKSRALFSSAHDGRHSNRLDRVPCKLDPLLPTKQIQQNDYSFVWPQNREHPNLCAQRTADHPHAHAWYESVRLRQLDEAVAFSGSDFSDDSIRDARRLPHHPLRDG
jgi:hypothetical protein